MDSIAHTAGGPLRIKGFEIHKGLLLSPTQRGIVDDIRRVVRRAPFFTPTTPSGRPMSVRMTSAGSVGWYSDRSGYRYIDHHPSGSPWPDIPETVLKIWHQLVGQERKPDCCLVNFYVKDTKMGMHQDKDEATFDWPVVSISLGDDALFRMGNAMRGGSTQSHWLSSGDVVVMGGDARLAYHGVDRLRSGSSTLLPKGGRINLTLRVVR